MAEAAPAAANAAPGAEEAIASVLAVVAAIAPALEAEVEVEAAADMAVGQGNTVVGGGTAAEEHRVLVAACFGRWAGYGASCSVPRPSPSADSKTTFFCAFRPAGPRGNAKRAVIVEINALLTLSTGAHGEVAAMHLVNKHLLLNAKEYRHGGVGCRGTQCILHYIYY